MSMIDISCSDSFRVCLWISVWKIVGLHEDDDYPCWKSNYVQWFQLHHSHHHKNFHDVKFVEYWAMQSALLLMTCTYDHSKAGRGKKRRKMWILSHDVWRHVVWCWSMLKVCLKYAFLSSCRSQKSQLLARQSAQFLQNQLTQ